MLRPAVTREALRFRPLMKARWADASRVENAVQGVNLAGAVRGSTQAASTIPGSQIRDRASWPFSQPMGESEPNPKQNAPDSSESWDVKSNSPPPKPAQSQSTNWRCWCEWPNRAMGAGKSRGAHPRSNNHSQYFGDTTNEPLHKPQEQRKLMLDDAEVMVGAGRSRHR